MADLEDGELLSDEEIAEDAGAVKSAVNIMKTNQTDRSAVHNNNSSHFNERTSYRQTSQSNFSSDDDSSDSDGDYGLKSHKRRSHNISNKFSSVGQWNNPNRAEGGQSTCNSQGFGNQVAGPEFWTGEMAGSKDRCSDYSLDGNKNKNSPANVNPHTLTGRQSQGGRRVRNNIWGTVLTEQSLTHDLGHVGVDNGDYLLDNDRDVESYNYLKAREYMDEENEGGTGEVNKRRAIKRKHVKDRLGVRGFDTEKSRGHIGANCEDDDQIVSAAIVRALEEPKSNLIERIVKFVGKKKSLELLYQTEDIEDSGGIWTVDGIRRRTPGGVYLQLLKSDPDIEKDQIKEIFAEENKLIEKQRKKARAYWRRIKAEETKKKASGQQDGMSTESENEGDGNNENMEYSEQHNSVENKNIDIEEAPEILDSGLGRDEETGIPFNYSKGGRDEETGMPFSKDKDEIVISQDCTSDGVVLCVDPYELETFS